MDRRFELIDFTPYGDPTNGESYQVTIRHDCPLNGIVEFNTGLSRACIDQEEVTCEKCSESVTVNKNIFKSQIIYIAPKV